MFEWAETIAKTVPADVVGIVVIALVVIWLLFRHLEKMAERYERSIHELSMHVTDGMDDFSQAAVAQNETLKTLLPLIISAIRGGGNDH